MVKILFLMLSCLSFCGNSFAEDTPGVWQRIGRAFQSEADRQEKQLKPIAVEPVVVEESVQKAGIIQSVFCAPIVVPGQIARFVQGSLTPAEQDETNPWFWQRCDKPTAVDVATYSMVPWYAHAFHGYYQRLKNLKNDDIMHYPNMLKRLNALDFETFNKWHPIQSMKGSKRVWLPLIGPMIAAHATGLAYHAAFEHTPGKWRNKKVNGA